MKLRGPLRNQCGGCIKISSVLLLNIHEYLNIEVMRHLEPNLIHKNRREACNKKLIYHSNSRWPWSGTVLKKCFEGRITEKTLFNYGGKFHWIYLFYFGCWYDYQLSSPLMVFWWPVIYMTILHINARVTLIHNRCIYSFFYSSSKV